jgi:hypothetical protein
MKGQKNDNLNIEKVYFFSSFLGKKTSVTPPFMI